MIPFAAYTAAETRNAFQRSGQTSKLPLPGGISSPPNTWFLEPTRLTAPNGISIGSAVFEQYIRDQHTDKQTNKSRYVQHL